MKKVSEWIDICKLHWKEIVTLSVALHWIVDLLILGPVVFFLGYLFGVNFGN